jgi:hypothetical protein
LFKENETNTEKIGLEVISYDLLTSQHDAPKSSSHQESPMSVTSKVDNYEILSISQ